MHKKNKTIRPLVLLLAVIPGFVSTVEAAGKHRGNRGSLATMTRYVPGAAHSNAQAVHSDCRRDGVVWSGGIARRGPDRISPRPVRSRWQAVDESRIYCAGSKPFSKHRVADLPWIR
jgi:hypothetical protein